MNSQGYTQVNPNQVYTRNETTRERESLMNNRNQTNIYVNRLPPRDYCSDRTMFGINSRSTDTSKRIPRNMVAETKQDDFNIDRHLFNLNTARYKVEERETSEEFMSNRRFDNIYENSHLSKKYKFKQRMDPVMSHHKIQKKSEHDNNVKFSRQQENQKYFKPKYDIHTKNKAPVSNRPVQPSRPNTRGKFNPSIRY